jgi:hypothetical protein
MQQRPLRSQDQASEYIGQRGLKVAPNTLAKLRTLGGGPRYRKFGRFPVYDDPDLDDWIEEKLSAPLRSTSEEPPADGDQQLNEDRPRRGRPRIVRDAPAGAEERGA